MREPNYIQGFFESKKDRAEQLFKINHLSGEGLKDRLDQVKALVDIYTRRLNDARYHYHEVIENLASLRNKSSSLEFKEYEEAYDTIEALKVQEEMLDDEVYDLKIMNLHYIRLEDELIAMYTRESEQTEIKLKETK